MAFKGPRSLDADLFFRSQLQSVILYRSITRKPLSNMPNIQLLPPSDFKDLLLALQALETPTSELLQSFAAPRLSYHSAQKLLLEKMRSLERKYTDIDTHYGWVLASDRKSVARMFEQAEMTNAEGVATWMKRVSEQHAEIRDSLREWVRALEEMVEEGRW